MDNIKKAYLLDTLKNLNKMDKENTYIIRHGIHSIDSTFFFNSIDLLLGIIERQEKEINEYENDIIEEEI